MLGQYCCFILCLNFLRSNFPRVNGALRKGQFYQKIPVSKSREADCVLDILSLILQLLFLLFSLFGCFVFDIVEKALLWTPLRGR